MHDSKKTEKQKKEEEDAKEVWRYAIQNYTDSEIMSTLNISRSKLYEYKEMLGKEIYLKKYTPEKYPKTIATAIIEFKERIFSLIHINKEVLLKPKISPRDRLRFEKLNRKFFVRMIKELANIKKTDLNFQLKDNELEEDFRKTMAQVKQLSNSNKIDTMIKSDVDKMIDDWLTEEQEKKRKNGN
jgi:hypothetical protein